MNQDKQSEVIERLRELLARATPGPWELQDGCSWRRIGTQGGNGNVLCPSTYSSTDNHPDLTCGKGEDLYANLRLIVEAINALPALLEALSRPSLSTPAEEVIERVHDPEATLVASFAEALLAKLRASEQKYGWNRGWMRDNWADDLRRNIRRHVEKGDPIDVAAYCAFAWHHDWPLALPVERHEEELAQGLRDVARWIQAKDPLATNWIYCVRAAEALARLSPLPLVEENQ